MFINPGPSKLCVVTDARFKYDRQCQDESGGQPVMKDWSFGKAVLGPRAWESATRVALYDYGEDTEAYPTGLPLKQGRAHVAKQRAEKRSELVSFLHTQRPACTVILQTRSTEQKSKDDFGDAKGLKGTMGWAALDAPDSLAEMAGCVWESPHGPVMPLLNPVNYEHVHGEAIRRQLRGAFALASGREKVLLPPNGTTFFTDVERSRAALRVLRDKVRSGVPLAIDIESYSTDHLITAVGLSDGVTSVSVPWEAFRPYRQDYIEAGASSDARALVRDILAGPGGKIFHNFTYDVPFLESKGCPVGGVIHDTFAMHGIVYKQWRHGLQRACSAELLIPPWKSIWHPKHPPAGLSKDDAEWWILEPLALREYNARDSFYTWHLAQALSWKVGVKL